VCPSRAKGGQLRDRNRLAIGGSPVNLLTRLLLLGSDPLGGTAAPLRQLPPYALPMSVVSARVLDGAHAIG